MGFTCGIVGLPNVGKSTIFNALTHLSVPAEAFPFCTIDPNIGKVPVPDERLKQLETLLKPEKITPATLEFVDIAGLVKGASKGEGLGNQFLGHIKNAQAIAMVVRVFSNENIPHVTPDLNPIVDIETVELELILADLQTIARRLDKLVKLAKVGDKAAAAQSIVLEQARDWLDNGGTVRNLPSDLLKHPALQELCLITAKPVMFVLNLDDDDYQGISPLASQVKNYLLSRQMEPVLLCGKIESELALLSEEDQKEYREAMGLSENGLMKMIKKGYALLNLITFYTTVGVELRAWTIKNGTTVQVAAGKIHTDMERGFIKAEVLRFEDIIRLGSESRVRDAGLMSVEGREYLLRDGDIVKIKFNV